ncbi:MAG: cytidylate kinase family protein, partial [Magnetococcales bacterium]|nr:cytidylate kinase family protein [Magnetococcales bacterium]
METGFDTEERSTAPRSQDPQTRWRREDAPTVITVSRHFGANGGKIAELLSQRLLVPCHDHSSIDALAHRMHLDKKRIAEPDEKPPNPLNRLLHTLFSDRESSDE